MTNRNTTGTLTFAHPFTVRGYKKTLPAGVYKVDTEEELILGLSFPAYRRTQAELYLHADPVRPAFSESLILDPKELDAAQKRDSAVSSLRQCDKPARPQRPFDRAAIDRAENEGMVWISGKGPRGLRPVQQSDFAPD